MSQQWNPLQDLVLLQDRMNRLFEDATQRRTQTDGGAGDQFERADWTPASDIYETDSGYLIAIDLPGIDRNALEIDIDDNRLVVKGVREVAESRPHRTERPRGKFLRTYSVPGSVDQAKIAAEYKDGVLQVSLPKRTEPKPKKIDIKIS
ncbi:MAG TPA: Hsp20/alpha crystallin family protein [Pyrinomonadaceae bacterium]|jgi:HSP20 family protein|nr:Hsp20/alpha crystallin family protein [Pyrinomonadaceae bacterium]